MQYHPVKIMFALVAIFLVATACNKDFEEPPIDNLDGITANTSIQKLKTISSGFGKFDPITGDTIISGIVIANDKSGNFYKEIYIEDNTGGIAIELDAYGLFNSFPVGREVFIVCKGLYLANENGMLKLCIKATANGSSSVAGIPASLIDVYVKGGTFNHQVQPITVTATGLNASYQGMLVALDNYEVVPADTSKTFADTSVNKATQNISIANCSGDKLTVRTSGYANFAAIQLPKGNGTVKAIYTVYAGSATAKPTKQLLLRDTTDMRLNDARCDGSATFSFMRIADLRNLYNGSDIILSNIKIGGVIISDAASKNIAAGNMVLQDSASGIDLYFGSSAKTTLFNIGDSVVVDLNGGKLTSYNGLLEVNLASTKLPVAAIAKGKTIVPLVLSAAQFKNQIDKIECTLVALQNVTPPTGTYAGNKILTDATEQVVLFTQNSALFATQNLPTVTSTFVGYGIRYKSTPELVIRNLGDVTW